MEELVPMVSLTGMGCAQRASFFQSILWSSSWERDFECYSC